MSITIQPQTLASGFASPLGRYLLERELRFVDQSVADVFGYNALQLGLPEHDFLRSSRISFRCRLASEGDVDLRANFYDLPIASNSVDLLVMPHVLEFSIHPHQIVREVGRVLMPEGHALIIGFNPRSLWGLWNLLGRSRDVYPWCGKFIALPRLKDWLALLELEVDAGRMGCYVPPCTREQWLHRLRFMEAAGDRWWPIGGGIYYLHVIKRLRGMRIIQPRWREHHARRRSLAIVPKRVGGNDDAVAARNSDRTP